MYLKEVRQVINYLDLSAHNLSRASSMIKRSETCTNTDNGISDEVYALSVEMREEINRIKDLYKDLY